MDSDEYMRPPGTYYDILAHPADSKRAVEVAVVQDHRFAFFYWLKWRNRHSKQIKPPSLVSLDWHQDLVAPCDLECEWLRQLDIHDYKAVSFFCWDKLHCLNDGQILAAAYLNIIGDVHVLQKQRDDFPVKFEDISGGVHAVRCYDTNDDLLEAVSSQEHPSVILDIDLDYFTESSSPCGNGADLKLVAREDITRCLQQNGKLMSWVLPRICGMTIATEPEFCGGLINSNYLFGIVNDILFYPPLLSGEADWRRNA